MTRVRSMLRVCAALMCALTLLWPIIALAQEAAISAAPADAMDVLTVILVAALAVSEVLALVPALQSNGIVHMVILALRKALGRPALSVVLLAALAIGLSACSTQGRQVVARISADLKTVAVAGCALHETEVVELTVEDVLATLPPGSSLADAQRKMSALDAAGDAACVLVDAVQHARAEQ